MPHRQERHRRSPPYGQVRAREVRADLGAERRDLVALLARTSAREQPHLQMRHADRAESLVREVDDPLRRAVHHALRQLPRRLADVRDEVVADLGHRAGPHLVALAQDPLDVGGELVERRRLRDPAVGRSCATRRSAGLPEPPIQIGGCGCCTGRGRWPTSPIHSFVSASLIVGERVDR